MGLVGWLILKGVVAKYYDLQNILTQNEGCVSVDWIEL